MTALSNSSLTVVCFSSFFFLLGYVCFVTSFSHSRLALNLQGNVAYCCVRLNLRWQPGGKYVTLAELNWVSFIVFSFAFISSYFLSYLSGQLAWASVVIEVRRREMRYMATVLELITFLIRYEGLLRSCLRRFWKLFFEPGGGDMQQSLDINADPEAPSNRLSKFERAAWERGALLEKFVSSLCFMLSTCSVGDIHK